LTQADGYPYRGNEENKTGCNSLGEASAKKKKGVREEKKNAIDLQKASD